MKYIVEYKEVGSDIYRTTSFTGDKSEEYIIDFFGLDGSDIEDYKITKQID